MWQTLKYINDKVNADISPEADEDHYGRAEYWTIPTDGFGDCEDYALAKRKDLVAVGLPADALRLALVRTRDGKRHAVLTVTTSAGDYVLDNLNPTIKPWQDTDYTWIARQSADNAWRWVALQADSAALRIAEQAKGRGPAPNAMRPDSIPRQTESPFPAAAWVH